jgi:hypothetical protein
MASLLAFLAFEARVQHTSAAVLPSCRQPTVQPLSTAPRRSLLVLVLSIHWQPTP